MLLSTLFTYISYSESCERSGTMCMREQDGGNEVKIAMQPDKESGLLEGKVSEQTHSP